MIMSTMTAARLHSQHRAFGTNKNPNFPIRRGFVAAECPSTLSRRAHGTTRLAFRLVRAHAAAGRSRGGTEGGESVGCVMSPAIKAKKATSKKAPESRGSGGLRLAAATYPGAAGRCGEFEVAANYRIERVERRRVSGLRDLRLQIGGEG